MIRLHVNIDHVATLRNARGTRYPDPVLAAQVCEQAGADGITLHLREDRRHIRDDDVERMRATVGTLMNLEMAATDEMATIAGRIRPDAVTLVPERREERTTEGGLDVVGSRAQIQKIAGVCRSSGIKLSLFINPDPEQIEASHALGAQQIELHTGVYCDTRGEARRAELARLVGAAHRAAELGLEVAAGHGLTRHNLLEIAAIPPIVELNIGHAVISDAVFMGLDGAVKAFREAVARGIAQRGRTG